MGERKDIREWVKEGVTRVRLPQWNEWAYCEVSAPGGSLHPWAYLWDVGCPGIATLTSSLFNTPFEQWVAPENYQERRTEIYGSTDTYKVRD